MFNFASSMKTHLSFAIGWEALACLHRGLGQFLLVRAAALVLLAVPAGAADAVATAPAAPWVEANFPFFSSVLDARKAGAGFPTGNLSPRGIVLNVGQECWVCFDPDLLRVTALWNGAGVAARSLAPGSYSEDTRKTPMGQTRLASPEGNVWIANGIYPGWQIGTQLSLDDPRSPAPSPEEVGRGPIGADLGRLNAVRLVGNAAQLEYSVGSTGVRESWSATAGANGPSVVRQLEVMPSTQPLILVLGYKSAGETFSLEYPAGSEQAAELVEEKSVWSVRLPARTQPVRFAVVHGKGAATPRATTAALRPVPTGLPARRWPGEVTTTVTLSKAPEAYVIDHIGLPVDNPWHRRVRPADIQFLPDGTGVLVTLDGDVWLARGLHDASGKVRWSRFTSGLHEPMTAAIRDGQIYVFDRNGIWRLRDTDGNGEADVHELFSNAFAQTADMREFPSTIRPAPDGGFVIAKGGQQDTTLGKHNGSVLRISADGRTATVLGYGFRQPNIAVNPRTGLVTSSDQQGQYIPSTPLHIVRDGQYYGFLAAFLPKEQYPAPIAEPLTWIPHAINASAISQIWLYGAKLGPLNDGLIHIGFNKPEIFRVLLNERGSRLQASVVSVTRAFDFTPLNGSVNPIDGQVYVAGFQVIGWGNVIDSVGGLGRLRYTGAPVTLPREVVPMKNGVLLRFDVALDRAKAANPANYSLQTWSYQRTYKYGSPMYKADGSTGQDELPASSAYVSTDGRSVFVGVPGLKPVMQMRVGWAIATAAGQSFSENAYTTPYELATFDPVAEGFGQLTVDLTPRAVVAPQAGPVTAEEGARLAQLFACVACHSNDGRQISKSAGPPWTKLFGRERPVYINGKQTTVVADENYLRESILEPSRKLAAGFHTGEFAMPSYAGVINPSQVEALILYLKSLR
jgi:glucose/arabinose dehydrogenase/mono/diheme cytochrome c family protein